ncbi:PucR family transcriptional regulator [Paractinoplanes rhizophilus]|jgi:hypothetical protein|uniref:PucR family transcriptional regulator n=1 Tax=Paractinoplanes rhizophilus TaxID=1416877 RepID=A0ABW2HSD5_9ACTN|nr:helix-turn-helix domain-containing protein [Actinoplanes sp.]
MNDALPDVRAFRLSPEVARPLRHGLPTVAVQTINAITAEVPAYRDAFAGEFGAKLERAVRAALGTFLELVSRAEESESRAPLASALEAAYVLGRGEARNGRSLAALLSAYRVGARVAWRELAAISVATEQPAPTVAHFAELVFAYIDELSAASAAGHADEVAASGRTQLLHRERLAHALISGEPEHALVAAAARAQWDPPRTLTAVLAPDRVARTIADQFDARTLRLSEAIPGAPDRSVLLIPEAHGNARATLLRRVKAHGVVVGPARPWIRALESFDRAVRALEVLRPDVRGGCLDTEDHLAALIVTADPQALADLRARVFAPLSGMSEAAVAKLLETLRSWLAHQGRRDEIAAELFVHPQTVRYRMTRLRQLYGDRLRDPDWIRSLTVALVAPNPA